MEGFEQFSFYPNKTINLFGKEITIEPYRVDEIPEYIIPIEQKEDETLKLQYELAKHGKRRRKTDKQDKNSGEDEPVTMFDLDEDDFKFYLDLKNKINTIEEEMYQLIERVAQLGLKRALYPEANDLTGKELDKYPKVNIPKFKIKEVYRAMNELANGVILEEAEPQTDEGKVEDDLKNENLTIPEKS